MVELYLESGLGRTEFCQEMGVKLHTFNYWLNRYKKLPQVESGFVPIEVEGSVEEKKSPSTSRAESRALRIQTPSGLLIEIPM